MTVPAGRHTVEARIDWTGSPAADVDVPPGGTVTVVVQPGDLFAGLFSTNRYLTLSVE